MSKTLIMAPSGSGKTASLRNMDPKEAVIIQVIEKDLPFPNGKNWKSWVKGDGGSKIVLSNTEVIQSFMTTAVESGKKIIILDDFVYLMANKVMDSIDIKGFEKWSELARDIYDLMKFPDTLPSDVRVYFMTHIEEDVNGNIKMKTAGKLIDNLLTPSGMFTTVLGMDFRDGKYLFKTNKERGSEPYKSPMGMFDDILIDNDLKVVDDTMCEYYGIGEDS